MRRLTEDARVGDGNLRELPLPDEGAPLGEAPALVLERARGTLAEGRVVSRVQGRDEGSKQDHPLEVLARQHHASVPQRKRAGDHQVAHLEVPVSDGHLRRGLLEHILHSRRVFNQREPNRELREVERVRQHCGAPAARECERPLGCRQGVGLPAAVRGRHNALDAEDRRALSTLQQGGGEVVDRQLEVLRQERQMLGRARQQQLVHRAAHQPILLVAHVDQAAEDRRRERHRCR
mmetsp:Transcript_22452/g.76270  ORF Transcript_22452/g.76270 Transcript_22452/m.76270 type:complete len:235 (-) Transcript_22452:53-757(-)